MSSTNGPPKCARMNVPNKASEAATTYSMHVAENTPMPYREKCSGRER
jgi:hypothetical protein